jgi:ubiquinol-cytochrome c reductase iron-sulfur subunit
MADIAKPAHGDSGHGDSRRDFLLYATTAVGVAGAGLALWPFVHSMNPAADTLALSSTEVDISSIAEGQSITVTWRGKPVFVRRRTKAEIEESGKVALKDMPDPQEDKARVKKPEWLIIVGVCTHLGCIPLGQKPADPRGEFGGWFCPCHGSHYDTSGRIRKGPAPANLPVPEYTFLSDTLIRIG